PTTAMVIAMMKEENRPTFGSTPAMMEKEIASGIKASATTRPARISRIRIFGVFNAVSTEGSGRYRSLSCVGEVTVVMKLENSKSNAEFLQKWIRTQISRRYVPRRRPRDCAIVQTREAAKKIREQLLAAHAAFVQADTAGRYADLL